MQAFVIMSFGDAEMDSVFTDIIKPSLEELGFTVTRADLSSNQTQILSDIVKSIASADLIIADVTGLNGNVMYELGLAHAMGRPTMMLTQDLEELPFDLRSYRTTQYSTHFTEAPKLAENVKAVGAGVASNSLEFSNPVRDFTPDFFGVAQSGASPTADNSQKEDSPEDDATDDRGYLDYAIEFSEAREDLQALATDLSSATEEIGERVTRATEEIQRITTQLGPKAAPTARQAMRRIADDFDEYAEKMETANIPLDAAVRRLGNSASGMAATRTASTEEERTRIRDEITSMKTAEDTFATTFGQIGGFADTLTGIPQMEQSLNRATKRAAKATAETAQIMDIARSEMARARALLESRLGDDPSSES